MSAPGGRTIGGVAVAIVGFAIAMTEFAFRWQAEYHHQHYDLMLWPILFGCVLIFVGGFIINPKQAEAAGGFVVGSGVKILGVLRTGNRASDPVVTVTAAEDPPTAPPPGEEPDKERDKGGDK